jgi:hypothetical protein
MVKTFNAIPLIQCAQIERGAQCPLVARYRYTWPGRDESFICERHVGKLRSVADAIGLSLQVIDLFSGLDQELLAER